MQYREDRKSGNKLSILGFGCMRFPRNLTRIDLNKTEQLVRTAIDAGVNYFDTAYVYNGSEEALGAVLHNLGYRDKIFIASKLPHQQCKTADDFERIFNEQLARLKTDHIDYYLIHNVPVTAHWERLQSLGIEEWIAEKKASGQIGQIGFSFHGLLDSFLKLLDVYDWDFCQIQYNYMDENYQAGRTGLLKANEKGIPVIVMEPLLGGKLATGLPKQAAELFKKADPDRTPVAWALQWLWDQPQVTVVLSGMNGMDQVEENIQTATDAHEGMLTAEEAATLERVIDVFRSAYKVGCTGCNYCVPCPQGVNIPGCFAAYNARFVTGFISGMTLYITSTAAQSIEHNAGAGQCIKCGACEKKCPQSIPIMQELEIVKKKMEPGWFKPVFSIVRRFV